MSLDIPFEAGPRVVIVAAAWMLDRKHSVKHGQGGFVDLGSFGHGGPEAAKVAVP